MDKNVLSFNARFFRSNICSSSFFYREKVMHFRQQRYIVSELIIGQSLHVEIFKLVKEK